MIGVDKLFHLDLITGVVEVKVVYPSELEGRSHEVEAWCIGPSE